MTENEISKIAVNIAFQIQGLLINFNEALIKDGIHRVVNNL
jgi:hypothetical protein